MKKIHWNEILKPKNIAFNIIGSLLVVFAIRGFMLPNKFLDGGITGISIFIYEITHIPFGIIFVVLNIPFIFLGYRLLGATFTASTIITIILIAIGITYVKIDAVTSDFVLIALFGGCLVGAGMGFCIRGGSSADGAEILAVLTTRRIGLNIAEVIFAFNALLFLGAAYFFGVTTALYSIITYFAAVKVLDYVVNGIEQYTSLNIISAKSDPIKSMIVQRYKKGITILKGERGYLPQSFDVKADCDIIVTVVTRLELLRIKQDVKKIDPKAFMYITYIKEASGGILSVEKNH